MVDEVVALAREARAQGGRVRSVVLMGTGEPLDNYEAVLHFIHLIAQPEGLGIGYRHISLSTCGLVPGIRRLAREGLPLTLSVSLHAPTDELRSRLMPVNRRYALPELLAACREYAALTGRRVTFEYALIAGVNDSARQARALAQLVGAFGPRQPYTAQPGGRTGAGAPGPAAHHGVCCDPAGPGSTDHGAA